MYYVLDEQSASNTEDLAVVDTYPTAERDGWLLGERFTTVIPEPLEFTLDNSQPGRLPDFLDGTIPLMSDRLIAALRAAGVDNIDAYRAEIRRGDGTLASKQYKAINVIGVVSAADMAKSKVAEGLPVELIDTSFDSLAIDESRASGLLLFRLAEAVTTVLVHETVKEHLEQNGFDALGFIPPEEWMT
jgi:uncharacterized protein DUF1629